MAFVYNHDIVHLDALLRRFTLEVFKCVSSSSSAFNLFDQERLRTFLDEIDRFHAWVIAQPQLDLPESHPTEYELEAPPEVADVENESVNSLIKLFAVTRAELINCQSARDPAGLQPHDSRRLTGITEKIRQFLVAYIATTQPTDLPESSPQAAMSGSGQKGT